jgi:hypothetical protein
LWADEDGKILKRIAKAEPRAESKRLRIFSNMATLCKAVGADEALGELTDAWQPRGNCRTLMANG